MAEDKVKGSRLYEFLIVVLAVVLVMSIIYPKKVMDQERSNMQICRERMSNIFSAELQYQKYNNTYTDTLSKVINFLRTNLSYQAYVDTVIKAGLDSVINTLAGFKAQEEFIISNISAGMDTAMMDSLANRQQDMKMASRHLAGFIEYIFERMKNLPNTPVEDLRAAFVIVDSKKFTLDMDIVKNSIEAGLLQEAKVAGAQVINTINSVTAQFQKVIDRLPEYKGAALDSLYNCPTIHKPYRIAHIDTSAIKYLNVYCPIDSQDVQVLESHFWKSKIGGLTVTNHGKIEKGEKSWEAIK
jgi:Tfp pilus assembly protein PilE